MPLIRFLVWLRSLVRGGGAAIDPCSPASPRLPTRGDDIPAWDQYWSEVVQAGVPYQELELYSVLPPLIPLSHSRGFRTVLYAGSGVSLEPRVFAAAGFDVTCLDVSTVAIEYAQARTLTPELQARFPVPNNPGPPGTIRYAVGSILDPAACPGPFDIIVCRSTLQWFYSIGQLDAALSALTARLSSQGLLVVTSHFPVVHLGIVDAIDEWLSRNSFSVVRQFQASAADLTITPGPLRRAWAIHSTG